MLRGRVDFLFEVGADALGFMQRSSSVNVLKTERPYAYVVFLSQHDAAVSSPAVRRALNAAVDRKDLIESGLQGHGSPAVSPVWPHNWAYDDTAPGFGYDPDAALSDFEKAGLGKIKDDKLGAPPARLRLTCLVPQGRTDVERLALVVQEQLSRFAVDFRLEPVPPNEFIQRVTSGNFDAAIIDATGGPSLSIPYWSWHSRSADSRAGMNYGDYKDEQVDKYLDQVRHAPDDAAYKQAVANFQRAIVQDPPAIFLAWSETFRAVNRRFSVPENSSPDILPSIRLWKPAGSAVGTQ
jgi:peptide/nickel transport system substrate-binding protein